MNVERSRVIADLRRMLAQAEDERDNLRDELAEVPMWIRRFFKYWRAVFADMVAPDPRG